MSLAPIFRGSVKNGKALPFDSVRFASHIRSMEGADVEIIVRKYRRKRTDPQRRYYFAVIVGLLAEHTGHTKEEVHDSLRAKFLTKHYGPLPIVMSTNDLNTVEAEEYYERCRQLGAEMSCSIPLPNEVSFDEY